MPYRAQPSRAQPSQTEPCHADPGRTAPCQTKTDSIPARPPKPTAYQGVSHG